VKLVHEIMQEVASRGDVRHIE